MKVTSEQRTKKQRRHHQIIAALQERPTVRIAELARSFGVSTETVRRDLDELTDRGLVARTYGGASTRSVGYEPPVDERDAEHVGERERIALAAASSVRPGSVLMVDAGSTTTRFARQLALRETACTVITNSLGVATALGPFASIRVILCPGDFHARENGVYGPQTLDFLDQHHADAVFMSASGMTRDAVTDADTHACAVKKRMLRNADRAVLIADRSKIGKKHLSKVAPLGSFDEVVCDAPAGPKLRRALARLETVWTVAADAGTR